MIKRKCQSMLAVLLICGMNVFTACTMDNIDNGVNHIENLPGKTVDLATLTADYTAHDGDTLTGKLANPVKITIADGACITIDSAYINEEGTVYSEFKYAAITCLGDATITLSDTSEISGFHEFYPAFFVPDGHTLTFQGEGILIANGCGSSMCAAIGSVANGEKCGNLEFLGGIIFATAGENSAAVGSSYNSDCGDITIGGKAAVGGFGSSNSAAIGAGYYGNCGNITIVGEVDVLGASGIFGTGIGAGNHASCKAITIGATGGLVRGIGGDDGSGIGTYGGNFSKCESITITGGDIYATGGFNAPAIGSGPENPYAIPITITSGIDQIIAKQGSIWADYIGAGADSSPCSVTIDGVENATPESTFPNLESSVRGSTWTLSPKYK